MMKDYQGEKKEVCVFYTAMGVARQRRYVQKCFVRVSHTDFSLCPVLRNPVDPALLISSSSFFASAPHGEQIPFVSEIQTGLREERRKL